MSSDLGDYISQGVRPVHPLDRMVSTVITNLLHRIAIPWLTSCIAKYDESFFHMQMSDTNWDFIADWEINHYERYHKFLRAARRFRNRFQFDTNEVTDRLVGALGSYGWTVFPDERLKLFETVARVKAEIYS